MFNDYINAIGGGLLIGSASLFLFLGIGRIAGVSGILWRGLSKKNGQESDRLWSMVFVAGLCFGGWLLHVITNIPINVIIPVLVSIRILAQPPEKGM